MTQENTLEDRIEDIVGSGQNSARRKTYELLNDALEAISDHFAIPVDELQNVVKDELK